MATETLHPYCNIHLERRWFKDPTEFDFICKELGIDTKLIEEIEDLDINVDEVQFEVDDTEDDDAS